MTRPACSCRRPKAILSNPNVIGPSSPSICSTRYGEPSSRPSRSATCAERRGVTHFNVLGKGSKTLYVPIHPAALSALNDYLDDAGHREDKSGALIRPVKNNTTGTLENAITGNGIYDMVQSYGRKTGIMVDGLCLHALRTTAATNTLKHQADIAYLQMWLGTVIFPRLVRLIDVGRGRKIHRHSKVNY